MDSTLWAGKSRIVQVVYDYLRLLINFEVYVSRIIPEGVAARHGGLKRGDQLLWVNGTPVDGESHDRVVELLKAAKGPVKLVVLYAPQVLENMERRFEELRLSRKNQR